ncbi:hypothetical protein CKF54_03830 [Psittacicella hinzii]|uniref:Cysteine-rich domain-containing protein n=1 Tax=Psittacicella hinzii TaxID=2028575 RepID=A0A3A1Y6M6_9GAMM|nr:(Fe-S)-binding protein [Psittacicella hinzii]RIY32940.1 hypothetical protein CKF54_03830 [Psittacicella hinzii]
MRVNLFVTCIGDVVKANTLKKTVLLLEKLGCEVVFLSKQTCCGQPALNSGYVNESRAAVKTLIKTFEENDYPIVAPAGSCINSMKKYKYLFEEGDAWRERAEKFGERCHDLTDFIVNVLGVTDVGAKLEGKAVYHASCSLWRKLGVVEEPIKLLKAVKGLELLDFENSETCCGFGGTFSVKMAEVSGEMVTEKVEHILAVQPDYVIGADSSCLINIGGRLSREKQLDKVKVLHIVDVLVTDEELEEAGY